MNFISPGIDKMSELTLDVTIANKFMSSLSKSLQALCHGCMEFDSGIEIIGYINVNIDSASKVDYVLNERVHKSTGNSIQFVSNSFVAKKDQPKTIKGRTRSPVRDEQSDLHQDDDTTNSSAMPSSRGRKRTMRGSGEAHGKFHKPSPSKVASSSSSVPHQRSNTNDVKREGFEEDDGTFSNVEIKKEPGLSDNFYLQTSTDAPAPSKSNTSVQSYHHSEESFISDLPVSFNTDASSGSFNGASAHGQHGSKTDGGFQCVQVGDEEDEEFQALFGGESEDKGKKFRFSHA